MPRTIYFLQRSNIYSEETRNMQLMCCEQYFCLNMLSLKILANDIDSPISITSPLYVFPSPILMGTPPGHCILYMTHVYEADSSIVSSITFCTMAIFSPSPESIIAYSTPSQNPIYFSDIVCFSHETSITSAVRSKSNLFITYFKSVSWPYTMIELAGQQESCLQILSGFLQI